MRNKLYITIFTIMSTILGGCEGGLEPEIYDNLTGDNFPKTEADAKTLGTMAKKAVATFKKGDGRTYSKVIKMVKSPKTGAYIFQEEMIPNEAVKDYFAK